MKFGAEQNTEKPLLICLKGSYNISQLTNYSSYKAT